MNIIKKNWQQFCKAVVPAGAGYIQLEETERAFYAGATAILSVIYQLGDEESSPEKSIEILEALNKEAREFAKIQNEAAQKKLMENPIGHG